MGKKKGKDKNKMARMSEEERLRYLQHRLELEEEAKRRKQQLISTFMKVNFLFLISLLAGCYKQCLKNETDAFFNKFFLNWKIGGYSHY